MAKKSTTKKGGWKRWRRNAVLTLVVLAIGYVGAHILSRTDGFRQAVADKLSNGTRQQISIGKCGMTVFGGLRLRGLEFQGVDMPEAKMTFNVVSFLSKETPFVKELWIKDMEIRFRRIPTSGHWEPLILHGVGARLGAVLGLNPPRMEGDDSLPKFPREALNEKTLLQLEDAKVVWKDENGREIAYITEADLRLKSETFVKRKVIQTIAKAGHVKLASGAALRDFRLEAFRVEGSAIITVLNMADSNGQYEEFSSATLWQDLNLHLNELAKVR